MSSGYEYPTGEELEKIKNWDIHDYSALMEFVKSIWWMPEFGWHEGPGGNEVHELTTKTLSISTGGWSGNESIITALENNAMFYMSCWVSSRRGGHYEFELPDWKAREEYNKKIMEER